MQIYEYVLRKYTVLGYVALQQLMIRHLVVGYYFLLIGIVYLFQSISYIPYPTRHIGDTLAGYKFFRDCRRQQNIRVVVYLHVGFDVYVESVLLLLVCSKDKYLALSLAWYFQLTSQFLHVLPLLLEPSFSSTLCFLQASICWHAHIMLPLVEYSSSTLMAILKPQELTVLGL